MTNYSVHILGLFTLLLLIYATTTTAETITDTEGPGANKGNFSCYDCNSFYSPACADWFYNRTWELVPCSPEETLCRKIVQEAWYDDSWNIRYVRQCAKHGEVGPDEGRRCIDRVGTYRIKMRYCYCDNKDGCNAAPAVRFSSSMILPGFLAFYLALWHRIG